METKETAIRDALHRIDSEDDASIDGTVRVLLDLLKERDAQDAEWGGPAHDDGHSAYDWFHYIDRQIQKAEIERNVAREKGEPWLTYRARLIKVAALAVAAIESHDRVLAGQAGQA
jgi:hypothetical protein